MDDATAVQQWNAMHPVGTWVWAGPLGRRSAYQTDRPAYITPYHGVPVVNLRDAIGAFRLSDVELLNPAEVAIVGRERAEKAVAQLVETYGLPVVKAAFQSFVKNEESTK